MAVESVVVAESPAAASTAVAAVETAAVVAANGGGGGRNGGGAGGIAGGGGGVNGGGGGRNGGGAGGIAGGGDRQALGASELTQFRPSHAAAARDAEAVRPTPLRARAQRSDDSELPVPRPPVQSTFATTDQAARRGDQLSVRQALVDDGSEGRASRACRSRHLPASRSCSRCWR